MAISNDQLKNVKSWAKGACEVLLTLSKDTHHERQIENRRKLLSVCEGMGDISDVAESLSDKPKAKTKELLNMFNDYFHYFDTGYKSAYPIDGLRDKLIDSLYNIKDIVK